VLGILIEFLGNRDAIDSSVRRFIFVRVVGDFVFIQKPHRVRFVNCHCRLFFCRVVLVSVLFVLIRFGKEFRCLYRFVGCVAESASRLVALGFSDEDSIAVWGDCFALCSAGGVAADNANRECFLDVLG